jgi:protein-disulfide isomerase-like protein with CxxC motif
VDRDQRVAADCGHPFYQHLNQILDEHGFDDFVEAHCAPFYAAQDRTAESDAGDLLPPAADRLVRGHRF